MLHALLELAAGITANATFAAAHCPLLLSCAAANYCWLLLCLSVPPLPAAALSVAVVVCCCGYWLLLLLLWVRTSRGVLSCLSRGFTSTPVSISHCATLYAPSAHAMCLHVITHDDANSCSGRG
jgi:hypothetical protein